MADPCHIIATCLDITPIPGLHSSFVALKLIWRTVQDLQSVKEQLHHLAGTIAQLLQTLDREHRTGRLVEANTTRELKNLHSLLVDISVFVQSQASYGILKIIYKHAESMQAIDQFHRRISTAVQAFNITALLNLQEWQNKNALARIQDQDSLNNRLASLESNQAQLAEQLGKQHSSVMAMMVSLQKTLDKHANAPIDARQRQFLSHSLNYLASSSGQHAAIRLDNWSITSFEVEFGTLIGSGGFGQVYKGVWNKTPVALKVLRADEGCVPSSACIRREIEAWSNLRHPHVLQFLGANIFDDRPFIVMPHLKNGNARDFILSNPSCDRLRILHHAALGLMHLHSQGVIHGDLKALNILIDDAKNAVLCDFGLSRVKADASSRSVKPGAATSVAGSRNWMSPERILGGALRKPVDIYAFGMTIYEIFTGDVPLGHLDYMEFVDLVVNRDIRPEQPDEGEAPDLPGELWGLAERCWQKAAKSRPDAAILCDELEQLVSLPRKMASTSLDGPEDVPGHSSLGFGSRDTNNSPPSPPPWPVPKDEQKSTSSSSAISPDKPPLKHVLGSGPLIIDVSNKPGVPTPASSSQLHSPPASETESNLLSGSPTVIPSEELSFGQYTSQAKALFDFKGNPDDPNELSLTKGEVLYVLDNSEKWWIAKRVNGQQGIVPSNYVQIIPEESKGGTKKAKWRWNSAKIWGTTKDAKPPEAYQSAPQPRLHPYISDPTDSNSPLTGDSESSISAKPLPSMSASVFKARARYAYQPRPEQTLELPFSKGELLDILDRQENWWIARRSDGKEGIIPSNYVQVV